MNLENYERFLIVDLEATCCDINSIPRSEMEIIEIGAVMVENRSFEITDEFQTFIKPERTPKLTPFCTELTSISQSEVDAAPNFVAATNSFKEWLEQFNEFAFCSWGEYDRKQIETDCRYHNQANPITAKHFNIKKHFSDAQGVRRQFGMAKALRRMGIALEGTHHRGIDDARNMAKLMPYIISPNN